MPLSSLADCIAELDGLVLADLSSEEGSATEPARATGRSVLYPSVLVGLSGAPDARFDTPLVIAVCLDLARYLRHAARSLCPASRPDAWSSWSPQVTFTGGRRWVVRFLDAPECDREAAVWFDGLEIGEPMEPVQPVEPVEPVEPVDS